MWLMVAQNLWDPDEQDEQVENSENHQPNLFISEPTISGSNSKLPTIPGTISV